MNPFAYTHSSISGSHTVALTTIPGVEGLSGQRRGETVQVSPGTMDALLKANATIDETRAVLRYGSGNQSHDIWATNGESFRRTLAGRYLKDTHPDKSDVEVAMTLKAGNCGEMAAVNAALIAYKGIDQPVSVMSAQDMDHSFVKVGDERVNSNVVISDAWPLFGRADLASNFALSQQYGATHVYPPGATDHQRANAIRQAPEMPSEHVNEAYHHVLKANNKQHMINTPEAYNAEGAMKLMEGKVYSQMTAAKDISQRYQGEDSQGQQHNIGHEVSRERYNDAMQRLQHNNVVYMLDDDEDESDHDHYDRMDLS